MDVLIISSLLMLVSFVCFVFVCFKLWSGFKDGHL
jgi:hypothetical protein